jgi:hypothetical protein
MKRIKNTNNPYIIKAFNIGLFDQNNKSMIFPQLYVDKILLQNNIFIKKINLIEPEEEESEEVEPEEVEPEEVESEEVEPEEEQSEEVEPEEVEPEEEESEVEPEVEPEEEESEEVEQKNTKEWILIN